jgi:hypothetical protein
VIRATVTGGDAVLAQLRRFQWTTIAAGWADDTMPLILTAVNAATPVGKAPVEGNAAPAHEPGYLRSRNRIIRRTTPGSVSIVWMNDADYAGYVIRGTSAHPISAPGQGVGSLHAKALHFAGSAGPVFRKTVMHPGAHANPYHVAAYATVATEVKALLDTRIQESLEG